MQILNPMAIGNITFMARNAFQVVSIDQIHREPASFQYLEQRDPIDTGGFHGNRSNATVCKPIRQRPQIATETSEPPDRFLIPVGRNSHINLLCADIDLGRVRVQYGEFSFTFLASFCHGFSFVPKGAAEVEILAVS
jgi:hypothetical protein